MGVRYCKKSSMPNPEISLRVFTQTRGGWGAEILRPRTSRSPTLGPKSRSVWRTTNQQVASSQRTGRVEAQFRPCSYARVAVATGRSRSPISLLNLQWYRTKISILLSSFIASETLLSFTFPLSRFIFWMKEVPRQETWHYSNGQLPNLVVQSKNTFITCSLCF